jgi:hypothetical protein
LQAQGMNNHLQYASELAGQVAPSGGRGGDGDSYTCSFTAELPPAEAMERIEDVGAWWTRGFAGSSRRAGDAFRVKFDSGTWVDFQVSEVVPRRKAVWLVTDCYLTWVRDRKEWKGTKIAWELSPAKEGTKVTMTHLGLTPRAECYKDCEAGWNFYAAKSLQKFMADGVGLPDGHRRGR